MAKDFLRTEIAYRCPKCGYATVGFLGGLHAVSDMLRLKCKCGESSLDIKKENDTNVHLSVPCVYCNDTHGYSLSKSILTRREITKLSCPFSTMDIAFIGDEDEISESLIKSERELSFVLDTLEADELSDIHPKDLDADDATIDPAVFDSINFLIRELEADGAVRCLCDDAKYALRFTDDGIQVYCESCGASYTFYAKTPAMAEEYMSLDKIELR